MNATLLRCFSWLTGLAAVVLLWLAEAAPAFADSRSITSYITGGNSRERVVQLCVVCMALALFIMMKKFAPDGGARRIAAQNRRTEGSLDNRRSEIPPQDSSRTL